MMFRKQSNPWMRTKGLYIIPVAVIALSAFATPELNNRVDAIAESAPSVIGSKGTTNSPLVQEKVQENDVPLIEQEGITEEKDSIKKQNINYHGTMEYSQDTDLKSEGDEVERPFDVVEHMPEFQGGMEELMKYLSTNVKYPKIAFENGVSARVLVKFIVEKDGSVGGVNTVGFKRLDEKKPAPENNASEKKVQIGPVTVSEAELIASMINSELTAEAQRVIASMPNWTPGTQNGKVVRVNYVIPITFRLQ